MPQISPMNWMMIFFMYMYLLMLLNKMMLTEKIANKMKLDYFYKMIYVK